MPLREPMKKRSRFFKSVWAKDGYYQGALGYNIGVGALLLANNGNICVVGPDSLATRRFYLGGKPVDKPAVCGMPLGQRLNITPYVRQRTTFRRLDRLSILLPLSPTALEEWLVMAEAQAPQKCARYKLREITTGFYAPYFQKKGLAP
jgi:hypothetical protein